MSDQGSHLIDLLQTPPADCRPAMFWLMKGPLTLERIRDQIQQMADHGCGGFFLHPMGEDFRLGDFISGIEPPYLSNEYFELIRVAVEEADELGLFAWLYDEGGWPSGNARGKVLDGHDEFRSKVLGIGGEGEIVAEVPVGQRNLLFTLNDVDEAVDHLNPDATQRFIELTHERYAEAVGEHFGGTVPGIFTDETSVPGEVGSNRIPWTGRMLEEFEARRGFDLRPWLPVLFSDHALGFTLSEHFSEEDIAAVRCEFNELWTDLFQESYFEPINQWCADHDLIHTGHVGGEDNLPDHRRGFGQFFKTAGSLHAPGIDAIWRQIFPGQDNFGFPQFATSALAHRGYDEDDGSDWRNLTLSETFAVYGYSLTPEQMRWVADYQFLRGINYMCPMALYSHTDGGHWIGTMSHLGEGNPLWDGFATFADHCAVMSAAVRNSEPMVDVAVYYPIEATWVGEEARQAAWDSLRAVTDALNSQQVAFDFIDAKTLAAGEVSDGYLATPGQLYGAVIVPETPVMPVDALEALGALRRSGGRIAFCGEPPSMAANFDATDAFEQVRARALDEAVTMDRTRTNEMGGDDPRGLGMTMTFPLDGIAEAFFGPGGGARFTEAEAAEGSCLVVPEDEIGRLAELLLLVTGRYELQVDTAEGELALASRVADEVGVHLLHNEGDAELDAQLMLISEEPRVVEHWDTISGVTRVLATHEEVSDPTSFTLTFRAGEAALITTRPLTGEVPETDEEPSLVRVATEVRAQSIEVVRQFVINAAGDIEIREATHVPDEIPSDFSLRPLEELGMPDFAGTAGYDIDLYVPPGDVEKRLFLDLGEVGEIARAWLNEEELGESVWPPHIVEITGLVMPGINDLFVEVTTTLANQAAREEIVQMARERGWFNAYYERTLDWMRDEPRAGLIGPVRVLRDSQDGGVSIL